MRKCAVSSPRYYCKRLASCVYAFLLAFTVLSAFCGRTAVADDADLADGRPPPTVEIFRWDSDSNNWINCRMQPRHVLCRIDGTVFVPIGSAVVPLDVSVGVECSPRGFSVMGSAELPVFCSVNNPCVINGVGVQCTQQGGQITCEFFVNENGSWVSRGTRVIDIDAVVDVFIDCTGEVITRVVNFVRDHGTIGTVALPETENGIEPVDQDNPLKGSLFFGVQVNFGGGRKRR